MSTTLPAVRNESMAALAAVTQKAAALAVVDHDSYTQAAALRVRIREIGKKLDAERKGLTKPLDDEKKAIMAVYKPVEEKLAKTDAGICSRMVEFDRQQEAARAEEQRRLEEYTRQKAAKEADARALELIAKGDMDGAEKALDEAERVAVPVLAPVKPIAGSGSHYRDNWQAEVTNQQAAIGYIVGHMAELGYLLAIDERRVREVAKMREGQLEIPGIKVWNEKTLVARKIA